MGWASRDGLAASARLFDRTLVVSYIPLVASHLTRRRHHVPVSSLPVSGYTLMTLAQVQNPSSSTAAASGHGDHQPDSLLGPAGRGMRFKVSHDESSTSRIFELASRKCLIGSAPNCNVRVDEPGVAPVECLIFTGAHQNIVRWLDASRGIAGGELFEDEILRADDAIQIGPVELELLVDELIELEAPAPGDEPHGMREDLLEQCISRLARLERQIDELQQTSNAGASPPKDTADDLDPEHDVAAAVNDLAADLAMLQSSSDADRGLWADARAEFESSFQSQQGQFRNLQEEVQHLRAELAVVRNECEQLRTAWQADRSALESELSETKEQVAQSVTMHSIEHELRETSERERTALHSQIDEVMTRLDKVQEELDTQRLQLDAVRQSGSQLQVPNCDQSGGTEDQPCDHEAGDAPYNPIERMLATSLSLQDRMPSSDEEQELTFETASADPPVSTADVLARLGQSGAWNENEFGADEPSGVPFADVIDPPIDRCLPGPEPTATTPLHESLPFPSADDPLPALSMGALANDSSDEEESIEAYMARLMNRMRTSDERDGPSHKSAEIAERSPVVEYTEVVNAPPSDQQPRPAKINPEEYKPRSQAPEAADRLSAMRSLANDSARSAIASHAKRNWSSVIKLKLLVSVFMLAAVAISMFFSWGNPLLMGVDALVGIGVLIYWARTAIMYRKLLLDSLMLEPEGIADGQSLGEEAAE